MKSKAKKRKGLLMIRKIIQIEEDKCIECGLCVNACHEGAIGMMAGKARLLRDDYCDGLGDCLPACPTGAITFVEREAAAYDEAAVLAHRDGHHPSQIASWPIEIKLVPIQAPYFEGTDLLVAADCTAFAYGDFHRDLMAGRVTIIGCPKLDGVDYAEKLSAIIAQNDIKSLTVARMEVPCCGGLQNAVLRAREMAVKELPLTVVTFSRDGNILSTENL